MNPEWIEERNRLLNEGFADWKRQHFYSYLGAIRRYGRGDLGGVQEVMSEMGKSAEEVARYHEVFWRRGPTSLEKWPSILAEVQKAEARARDQAKLERAVAAKIARCTTNPWNSEELVYPGAKLGAKKRGPRSFTPEDDRMLLCLVRCPCCWPCPCLCVCGCGCVWLCVAVWLFVAVCGCVWVRG